MVSTLPDPGVPVPDLRMFVVGDSFVAGVGDPEHLGWTGRLAARTHRAGRPLTLYNLGVRGDTSSDVRARWAAEVAARRAPGGPGVPLEERMVLSFGVNDTTAEGAGARVDPDTGRANLRAVLQDAATAALPLLVVGPPPVDDLEQNRRTGALNRAFRRDCAAAGVAFVDVFDALAAAPEWLAEVRSGDGAHPAGGGYRALAELVFPIWWRWICTTPRSIGG